MSDPVDSLHFKVVVRDASDEASALIDFEGDGIEPVTDEAVVLDPSFRVFEKDPSSAAPDARRVHSGTYSVRDAVPFYASKKQLQTFGVQLYHQLFGNESLLMGLAAAQQSGKQHNRPIRLSFENRDADFADIPWESLCRPGPPPEHLGDSQSVNIVRSVKGLSPLEASSKPDAVRVLIATASPDPANPVLIDRELLAIGEHVGQAAAADSPESLTFEWLNPLINTTKDALVRALEKHRPHIVHFIGHGSYAEGHGYLHLHSQQNPGEVVRVSAGDLVTMMRDRRPELFLLNSCEGAVGGSGQFTGVAESLLKTQCARFVVAMQYPVSNAAAIAFVKGFYPSLQRGDTIDVAVSSGRNRIHVHEREDVAVEFITPALYMNGRSGHLFAVPPQQRPLANADLKTPPDSAVPPTASSRPGWLVPVLATVVLLALIAGGTYVLSGRTPESVQELRITIEQGDVASAREALRRAQAECESGQCSDQAEQSVNEAVRIIEQISSAQTQITSGNWSEARDILNDLENRPDEAWLSGELDYLEESNGLIDTQLEAEAALRANRWQDAESGFGQIRGAVSAPDTLQPGTEQLLGAVARTASASGQQYAQARNRSEQAIQARNWQLAKASMRKAYDARANTFLSDPSAIAGQTALQQVIDADEFFAGGDYEQARQAYRSVLGTALIFESGTVWTPLKTHAAERLQEISRLLNAQDAGNATGGKPVQPVVPVEPIEPVVPQATSEREERVPFATDSAAVTSSARLKIDRFVKELTSLGGDVRVQVIGRADARGSSAYNLALGLRRAEAIANALASAGVSRSRVSAVSVGELWAVQSAVSPEQWAADRTSVLFLVPSAVSSVPFDFDSVAVDARYEPVLQELARWLSRHPAVRLSLVGHTDSSGTAEVNERIGQLRAQAVAQSLIGAGIDSARLSVSSAGETRPLKPQGSNGAADNRRVELVLYRATRP